MGTAPSMKAALASAKSVRETGRTGSASDGKIVRRKLSDEVFERLRAMISAGELQPGDTIPSERELMQTFGVGRPAVREALQSMQTMGLITISHGGPTRVNALSPERVLERVDEVAKLLLSSAPDQLENLKEARKMFELGIVRVAAERATKDDIADLRLILDEQRGHFDRQRGRLDEPRLFIDADMRFHNRIAQATANPILAAVSHAMLGWLMSYHKAILHWSGHEQETLADHERILSLVATGDPEGSVAAMRSHLDRSGHMYRFGDHP